ncbi:response regulator [Dyadobacter luteus]|jgi:CheY-like chemotaxis protein|uniref:Response regulator n=1 Tax=Dyadobacter luteus TaxID=2259619 RepID=A0A3D8YGV0_9BACT|nr:response regulator [Dyadobacter luteus]REA64014.1 response regulator [Dyadobacter luteus]
MDIFSQSFSLQTLTILLVDDDKDDILVFTEAISDFQITIDLKLAYNGLDAISLLTQIQDVDIIFLDINMHLMNGFECLAEIRKQRWTLPVVMLSSSNMDHYVSQSRTLGANGFITKPASLTEYQQTVKNVLSTDWAKKESEFYLDVR